jgi:hypothetical protein
MVANGSPYRVTRDCWDRFRSRSELQILQPRIVLCPTVTSSAPLGHLMTMRAMHSFQIQMEAEGAAGVPGG